MEGICLDKSIKPFFTNNKYTGQLKITKSLSVKLMTIRILIASLILVISNGSFAQDSFSDYKSAQFQEFQEFTTTDSLNFLKFVGEIEKKWTEYMNSTSSSWITYSSEGYTKAEVNFKDGYLSVESLSNMDDSEPQISSQLRISNHIQELLSSKEGGDDLLESTRSKILKLPEDGIIPQINQIEVLRNLFTDNSGALVSSANTEEFGNIMSKGAIIEDNHHKGKDGIERVRIKVVVPMVPDHLELRAKRYLPIVQEYCSLYLLDVPTVMAIIHTESYFNPKAKSSAPAYGLMQLVPRYGGKAAYKYIFGIDKTPSPKYLYNPKKNIELGTAYLSQLRDIHFQGMTDSQNALYCMICAYNTGPRNVIRAISGGDDFLAALPILNTLKPEDIYLKLKMNLPAEETKEYLRLVLKRIPNYVAWR